jgi:steroid 5-alpha reductase family enzyme
MEPLLFNSALFLFHLLCIVTLVFVVAQIKKDNSIMDIAYGPIFLVTGLLTYYVGGSNSILSILILLLTALWSTRLATRLYIKNHNKPEDIRYAAWRTLWSKKGYLYFLVRSYVQINILQGVIIAIISLPFLLSLNAGSTNLNFFTLVGVSVFAIGFAIESIADYQLDQFIARKIAGTEKANLMRTGLFRYSRRPNYFGETLIWWGLAIMVLPLPLGWLALLSPLMITYIVTKVTGPMLEAIFIEKYGDEYRDYMQTTSYFIPLPPKDSSRM